VRRMMHAVKVNMLDDKPESIFIRDPFVSPPGVSVETHTGEHDGWLEVSQKEQLSLDLKIRDAGWHFMWLTGPISRRGFGWSFAAARSHSIRRSLSVVNPFYNVAEIGKANGFSALGLHISRVTLHARQIQAGAELDPSGRSQ
jgi:hypothetical protein